MTWIESPFFAPIYAVASTSIIHVEISAGFIGTHEMTFTVYLNNCPDMTPAITTFNLEIVDSSSCVDATLAFDPPISNMVAE